MPQLLVEQVFQTLLAIVLKHVGAINMLFFLSSNISARRKVFYSGIMLIVLSFVFFNMSYSTDFFIMDWIVAGFNSGLSMILLSIIFKNTKKNFEFGGVKSLIAGLFFLC